MFSLLIKLIMIMIFTAESRGLFPPYSLGCVIEESNPIFHQFPILKLQ